MASSRRKVFRVTGLPMKKSEAGTTVTLDPTQVQALLKKAIEKEIGPHELAHIQPRTVCIVPSCIPNNTYNALVDFSGGEPTFLGELIRNPLSAWQIEMEVGNDIEDITFDLHFHGFTQLYATVTDHPIIAE